MSLHCNGALAALFTVVELILWVATFMIACLPVCLSVGSKRALLLPRRSGCLAVWLAAYAGGSFDGLCAEFKTSTAFSVGVVDPSTVSVLCRCSIMQLFSWRTTSANLNTSAARLHLCWVAEW